VIESVPLPADALRLLVLADGSSIHTEKWVRGLADTGPIELRLVTMNSAGVRAGLRDILGVRGIDEFYAGAVKTGGGNWRYLLNLPKVVRAVRRMKPDAIVAIYLSSYGLMGAIAKGDAVLAHVVIGSDVMSAPGRSRVYNMLARWTLARGDLCVCASQTLTARVSAIAKAPTEGILTQQYGLEDWVLRHPVLPKTYDFVSNRAWVPNSQIPMLLRTFARLRAPRTLALVGGGPPLETEIRAMATDDPRVIPLGILEHRQNVEVVARSAFYLSMTASDGASVSLMEAMAVGAIPVVSDIEPNREWVEHGVNGALIPLDDELAAVARIESFLARPGVELDEIRRRNREIIRERGSLTRNMSMFRDRLGAVLAQRRGGGA
jgi:glycosyltransferase involved in cell wall biosynthesis